MISQVITMTIMSNISVVAINPTFYKTIEECEATIPQAHVAGLGYVRDIYSLSGYCVRR